MAWLGTWAKRVEITLDNTNVDSDLTHFPVLIKLGHNVGVDGQDLGVVFDELTTNSLKIAVTDEDGTTQMYVEVEKWDNTVPEAVLWASSSTFVLHSARPTKIFLYYDSTQDDNATYVGVPNSVVAESVWDANFLMVQHMQDGASNAATYDSTSNDNDGAKLGANEPIEATGKIGDGQLFDNNDDFIETAAPVIPLTDFTVSALINVDDFATYQTIVGQIDAVEAGRLQLLIEQTTGKIYLQITTAEVSDTAITAAIWQAVDVTRVGTLVTFYNHGSPDGTATLAANVSQADVLEIGRSTANRMLGKIDEVRISDIGRSAAFIKAQKESAWDSLATFNLCGDWLSGWKQRIALTIDSSKIDSDLTHFPVMIRISGKCGASEQDLTRVFDEVGVEDQKIAVTDSTGVQQLYVEVEKWDSTNEEAILWVSRADWVIASAADTVIYLYYDADKDDNTYFVDVPGGTPGERVWDSNFVLVDHMQDGADTSHTRDSTSNDNDGTKGAANEPLEATGKIGEAQDYDATDDALTVTDASSIQNVFDSGGTLEAIIYANSDGEGNAGRIGDKVAWYLATTNEAASKVKLTFWYDFDGAADGTWATTSTEVDIDTYHHVMVVYDNGAVGNNPIIYVDGEVVTLTESTTPVGTRVTDVGSDLDIGNDAATGSTFEGILDEVRLSDTDRSAGFAKASYNACFDTLLTSATETATWKTGWDNRIKLTVSKDNIDEALEWFPLMIRLSASCGASAQDMTRVFDELGVEDLKLAITEADGETELYVEVEKWDSTGEEAILWVARDGFFFSSIVDTVLYLYYDADHADNTSYVGVTNSVVAESVWDANFELVWHMADGADTSHVYDSTNNDHDGTKKAANEPIKATGKVGEAQDFEVTDDRIVIGTDTFSQADFVAGMTLEAIVNIAAFSSAQQNIISFEDRILLSIQGVSDKAFFYQYDGGDKWANGNSSLSPATYYYLAGTWDTATNRVFVDAVVQTDTEASTIGLIDAVSREQLIGDSHIAGSKNVNGIVDEVRISSIKRADAWLKATKQACWDVMIAFSIEGETVPVVLIDIAWTTGAMADTPDWYDINSAGGYAAQGAMQYHFKKGRQNQLAKMQTGVADIVVHNVNGYFWPDKVQGPWYPYVVAGKKIRIRRVYDGTLYPRFVGFIDKLIPGWITEPNLLPIMTITVTDGMEHLSRTYINNAGEAQELSGTRIDNVLDEAAWPAADRDTAPGSETVQATGAQANVNATSHINKANESEIGLLFVAFDGDMTWHGRSTRSNSPYDTPLASFGDDLSEMPYVKLKMTVDRELLYNEIRYTMIGGTEQTEEDATSQTTYGKRSLVKTGLLNTTDLNTDIVAGFILARYKNATSLRVQEIDLYPWGDPADLFPKAFLYDISTRINIRLNEAKLDKDFFIEGVEEWAGADNTTRTKWQLSDVSTELYTPAQRTDTVIPTADGTLIQFDTIVGGEATNWESVADSNDATYVERQNIGVSPIDVFTMGVLPAGSATIEEVKLLWRGWKTGADNLRQRAVALVNGTYYYGGQNVVGAGAAAYDYTWALSPDTGVAWTLAEVTAAEFGYQSEGLFIAMTTIPKVSKLSLEVKNTPTWG